MRWRRRRRSCRRTGGRVATPRTSESPTFSTDSSRASCSTTARCSPSGSSTRRTPPSASRNTTDRSALPRRRPAGDAPENRAGHEPGPARVILIEETADELTRGEEPRHRPLLEIHHLPVARDPQTAEGERDARGHGEAHVRRRVEGLRPVALGRRDAPRGPAILDGRIERARLHGGVELLHGLDEARHVDLELSGQSLQRHVLRLGHLSDPVLLAQHLDDLLIEDLEGGPARLLDDGAAVLDVGVVAEVGALVDEAVATGVHDDAERIAVLLEVVAHLPIAVPGGVVVPLHGVTPAPVPPRLRPDVERHADAVAGVEWRPAHAREIP